MILYIPVLDMHDLTRTCLEHVAATVADKENFRVVIVDNSSQPVYTPSIYNDLGLNLSVIRNEVNRGMFFPLRQVHNLFPDEDIIGCIHNDVMVYETDWDLRVKKAFAEDTQLALLGFCGSSEVDNLGGRGGDTKCFFDGRAGQKQENTGRRISGLEPAAILDSLAMMFRASVILSLELKTSDPLYHFWDKVLPMKLIDRGLHVAVLGIQIDHMGGQTAVGKGDRFEPHALQWCKEQGVDFGPSINGGHGMYLEAEKRMFEFGAPRGLIPCKVQPDYTLARTYGQATFPWQFREKK